MGRWCPSGDGECASGEPLDVRQEYEKQLRDLHETNGEALLELRARKKLAAAHGAGGRQLIRTLHEGLLADGVSAHCCSSVCPHSRSPNAPSPGSHHDSRSEARSTAAIMPDNGMVERLIRTLKEQFVHRHRFESIRHATRAIGDGIQFYNTRRPHQALAMRTPAETFRLAA